MESPRSLELIRERIARASGSPEAAARLTLVAVSKTHPPEAVEALYRLGHRDFGENYAQEFVAKAARLSAMGLTDIRWHFIGHLQSNKAKLIAPFVHAVHSVDSEGLALELAKRWSAAGRSGKLKIFIEVNLDGEGSKSGVVPAEVPPLAGRIAANPLLDLRGLMSIPAPGRPGAAFARLRELEEKCRPHTRGGLSMGMTDDFEEAIRCGATHLRIGTAIFGARRTPWKPS